MKVNVKWCGESTFLASSHSGHHVAMDANGGAKSPSPMEMILIGAGGCSSVDVVSALKHEKQKIHDCEAIVTASRRDEAPRLFTDINLHFVVKGIQLDERLVAKAVKESLEKYCSVCLMLSKSVVMSHSYEIIAMNE